MKLSRQWVLQKIKAVQPDLQQRGVRALYLFGSVVRDEAGPDSDIDMLVEFDHAHGLFELFRLRFVLEQALGRKVDLIPKNCLRSEYREQVNREMCRAA